MDLLSDGPDEADYRERSGAPRNRTIRLSPLEEARYAAMARDPSEMTPAPDGRMRPGDAVDAVFLGDSSEIGPLLPPSSVDLLVADPPYDLPKDFDGERFAPMGHEAYLEYTRAWLGSVLASLKPTASVYVCSDWRSSSAVYLALAERLVVRNRITWKRDKGRSSASNWKNASEDVWFATVGRDYRFDADAVRLRKRVVAPYRRDGAPKDWTEDETGRWRLTGASNLWEDMTVPFWSMPENTDHPTQKPEKLIARILLASSAPGDLVLDPFLGSGTTAVAAKKLGRRFVGIERSPSYCALALRRLELAEEGARIQGYEGGSFSERQST
ncbi:MAG: site-specific DNA-methyltransferase [Spirochaetes bacterium]|nr:site-specific DNA-methyltransferase [Spirochaetota bacterium]MBU1079387.1 site-specific DNA-methyltransferase [Spirochaetota bacterium]